MSCAFTDCSMGIAEHSCHIRLRQDYILLSRFAVSILLMFPKSESPYVLLSLSESGHNFHVSHVDKTAWISS